MTALGPQILFAPYIQTISVSFSLYMPLLFQLRGALRLWSYLVSDTNIRSELSEVVRSKEQIEGVRSSQREDPLTGTLNVQSWAKVVNAPCDMYIPRITGTKQLVVK